MARYNVHCHTIRSYFSGYCRTILNTVPSRCVSQPGSLNRTYCAELELPFRMCSDVLSHSHHFPPLGLKVLRKLSRMISLRSTIQQTVLLTPMTPVLTAFIFSVKLTRALLQIEAGIGAISDSFTLKTRRKHDVRRFVSAALEVTKTLLYVYHPNLVWFWLTAFDCNRNTGNIELKRRYQTVHESIIEEEQIGLLIPSLVPHRLPTPPTLLRPTSHALQRQTLTAFMTGMGGSKPVGLTTKNDIQGVTVSAYDEAYLYLLGSDL